MIIAKYLITILIRGLRAPERWSIRVPALSGSKGEVPEVQKHADKREFATDEQQHQDQKDGRQVQSRTQCG